MIKVFMLPAFALFTLSAAAQADISNYAPDKHIAGRDEAKTICLAMGEAGKGFNLDGAFGTYGCQNQTNGNALTCGADGQCTDHVGDPRWRRIKDLIDAAKKKDAVQPL